MKLRYLPLAVAALGISLFAAGPVLAQGMPDLPGMGVTGQTGAGGTTTATGGNLPGGKTLGKANPNTASSGKTSAKPAAKGVRKLPATGAAVSGMALLAVAMIAGGYLLIELERKRA